RFLTVAISVLTPWPPLPSGEGELLTSPLSGTERGSGGEDATGGQGVRTTRLRGEQALKLGVASYSLRKFPRDRAIEMVKALGTRYVNLKSVHLPYEVPPAELAAARHEIEAAGLEIVGGGVITF